MPLVLVAEDAHWLDRSTADVLAFIARRLESDPIVLLVACRDRTGNALDDAGVRASVGAAVHQPSQDIIVSFDAADRSMYQVKQSRKIPRN